MAWHFAQYVAFGLKVIVLIRTNVFHDPKIDRLCPTDVYLSCSLLIFYTQDFMLMSTPKVDGENSETNISRTVQASEVIFSAL